MADKDETSMTSFGSRRVGDPLAKRPGKLKNAGIQSVCSRLTKWLHGKADKMADEVDCSILRNLFHPFHDKCL